MIHLSQIEEIDGILEVSFTEQVHVSSQIIDYLYDRYMYNREPRPVLLVADQVTYMDQSALMNLTETVISQKIQALAVVVSEELERNFAQTLMQRLQPTYPFLITIDKQQAMDWLRRQSVELHDDGPVYA